MTTSLAHPRAAAAPPEKLAWTGFELDGRVFAFPYLSVERVVPATPVTALPFAPAGVAGVASISGDIVPVLALPVLLGIERPVSTEAAAQFLVIRVSGRRFALLADRMLFVAAPLAGGRRGGVARPAGDLPHSREAVGPRYLEAVPAARGARLASSPTAARPAGE